jgi:hypothetical protein
MMNTDRNQPKLETPPPLKRPDLDEVNDASFDSFPASDAPVWSSMHGGPPRLRVGSATPKPPAGQDESARQQDPAGRG